MFKYKTLFFYLSRLYCKYFISVAAVFSIVLALSNAFDILQKFKSITLSSKFFWKFVLYKVPYLLNEITPLISFISMLFFVARLTKHKEIIIILGNGISLQRLLFIPVISALLIGILTTAIVNPLGAYGLQKYEYLEAKLTGKKHKSFVVIHQGLLLFEEYNDESRIISARSVDLKLNKLTDLTILRVDSENNFLSRIDAGSAILDEGSFNLSKAKIVADDSSSAFDELVIPTNLSINYFTHSLIMPEMISIWNLRSSINKFLSSGISVINYQIYFYKQLAKPLLMCATVMLGGCFISLSQRSNSQKKLFAIGLLTGFLAYSVIEIVSRILAYNGLAPEFAIMLPIFLLMLMSNFVVLHFNEA